MPLHKPCSRMLYKSVASDLADVDLKDGVVTMYWSAFDNEDSDGDIIEQGAYAKTVSERGPGGSNRIKFLWQHDPWEPIGRPTELAEDDRGLRAVVKVAPTTRGRDAIILYEQGVLTEHSVGIDILRRSEDDRRIIREVKLWEGSVVTWGANPLTPVLGMKGEGKKAVFERVQKQLRSMRKACAQPVTDELAKDLELACASLEAHFTELEKALSQAPASESAPEESTRKDSTPQSEDELVTLFDQLITAYQL